MKLGLNPNKSNNLIWSLIMTSRSALWSIFFFSCLLNILMLTGPLFMLQVYDRVLGSSSVPTLVVLVILVTILYTYYGFLEFLRSRILVRVGRRVEEGLRGNVFDAITEHAIRRTKGVGTQPITDLTTVRQFLSGQGPFAFFDMIWVPFYLFIIFHMHWLIGVASMAAAIVIFTLAYLSEMATRTPMAEANKASVQAMIMTEESRRNAEALQSLGMRTAIRNRWESTQQRALDYQTKANDVGGVLSAASRVVRLMVQSGILALGAYLAIIHELSPGSMIAASIMMGRALAPVELAVGSWQQFLGFRKAMDRLQAVLQATPKRTERTQLPAPKGFLSVENIFVQVGGSEKPVLAGISFEVKPGESVGVIGPTGAGKSTLAKVLVGGIPLARGAVRMDGAAYDQYDEDELGRRIGYLPQDVQLFDGTVAQNIARFSPHASDEKIVAAAKLANLHEFITRLPEGYDTPLGENGARLSAGQRQRLALARCLYDEPILFVLDEPNSNLDAEGEIALDRAMRASMQRGAAVVVVAHRPSALASVHNVLVLNEGRTMTYGPRDEVLAKVLAKPGTQGNPPTNVKQISAVQKSHQTQVRS